MSVAQAVPDTRAAPTAGRRIVRALDLAAGLRDGWPDLLEPVYFVAQGLAQRWPEIDGPEGFVEPREIAPSRWGPGENIWVVSTYLKLRARGLGVRIVESPVPDAINVCYLDAALRRGGSHRAFIVVTQGDRDYMNWGEFALAQSPALANRPRTCLIDCWPQPGLIARDPVRGTRIERIGYTGAPENLAAPFRSDAFRRDLERIGVEFDIRYDAGRWNDFSDLDLHLAVRDIPEVGLRTKPATKLIHSWLTGCPALLGPEASYRHWGADGADYVEVRRPADVIAAIERLRAEPELYRRIQAQGREKAVGHDEEGVRRQWAAALAGPIRREFEVWRRAGSVVRSARRVRRAWQAVAAPVSRKLYFARASSWMEIRGKFGPGQTGERGGR